MYQNNPETGNWLGYIAVSCWLPTPRPRYRIIIIIACSVENVAAAVAVAEVAMDNVPGSYFGKTSGAAGFTTIYEVVSYDFARINGFFWHHL